MLLKKASDIQPSEITPQSVYLNRREFIARGSAAVAGLAMGRTLLELVSASQTGADDSPGRDVHCWLDPAARWETLADAAPLDLRQRHCRRRALLLAGEVGRPQTGRVWNYHHAPAGLPNCILATGKKSPRPPRHDVTKRSWDGGAGPENLRLRRNSRGEK